MSAHLDTALSPPGGRDAARTVAGGLARILAGAVVCLTLAFLANFLLTFVWGWPGLPALFSHLGWFGFEAPGGRPLDAASAGRGWVQVLLYAGSVAALAVWVAGSPGRPLERDAATCAGLAAFIVRAAFWSVLLVGIVDACISFLRVEEFLTGFTGEEMATKLGLSRFRGQYVHIPLMLASCVVALLTRSLSMIWLSLGIVLAEFLIVITRFVFSYEQAFMGDLVRFWYAALFLLASAYSLVTEGHVRVDVLYARIGARGKAWTNAIGSMVLGVPFCWIILTMGMWTKGSSLSSPLLSFEISQSGFGMYVKYLMAGCLVVFAASMAAQFASCFLENVAVLLRGRGAPEDGGAPGNGDAPHGGGAPHSGADGDDAPAAGEPAGARAG